MAALEAGDDAAARSHLEQAVAESRGWLLPRLELAEMAVRRRERLAEEREALLREAGADSRVPRAQRLLAELAELLGDDEAAAAAWTRAIELRPGEADYHARRAAVLYRLGRFGEAADDWAVAARARPDEPHLQMQRAEALERAGRIAEARQAHEEAIRLQPGREMPVRRYARFLERQGFEREAAARHAEADRLRSRPLPERRNLRPLPPSSR